MALPYTCVYIKGRTEYGRTDYTGLSGIIVVARKRHRTQRANASY